MARNISKKRKFVADGVFFAELSELLMRELGDAGYAGAEVRQAPLKTEIIIRATQTKDVLGENGKRIRELTRIVQKRFGFDDNTVELYAERVQERGLCAQAQAEALKFKLLGGLPVRRASQGILRAIVESGAKGCQIVVSGKLRGQRAKAMKFRQGNMIKSGQTAQEHTDVAVRHVLLRQGMLGVKVEIMLQRDPTGRNGPKSLVADQVTVNEPKE